jgi:hypothetical protein
LTMMVPAGKEPPDGRLVENTFFVPRCGSPSRGGRSFASSSRSRSRL